MRFESFAPLRITGADTENSDGTNGSKEFTVLFCLHVTLLNEQLTYPPCFRVL